MGKASLDWKESAWSKASSMDTPFIDPESGEMEGLLEQMEEARGEPLKEEERHFLLTGDILDRAIKQDEIVIQKKRLKDLKDLFELLKELNTNVPADQEKMDAIHKAVDHTVNEHIAGAKTDLISAQRHKDALRKKQRICCIILAVAIVVGGLILYFKVIR